MIEKHRMRSGNRQMPSVKGRHNDNRQRKASAPNCIKHFHWTSRLFWPIRFDVTIVSIGNNCNVIPDLPESLLGTVVESSLIGQNHLVNKENPLYNWVPMFLIRHPTIIDNLWSFPILMPIYLNIFYCQYTKGLGTSYYNII